MILFTYAQATATHYHCVHGRQEEAAMTILVVAGGKKINLKGQRRRVTMIGIPSSVFWGITWERKERSLELSPHKFLLEIYRCALCWMVAWSALLSPCAIDS